MCAGRATHQPTSNGGENIACRNKSLIRGVSRTHLRCWVMRGQNLCRQPIYLSIVVTEFAVIHE
jgi:hypothetical protein